MSKITGSFLVLVLVIILSSIIYIWQADAEKKNLESQILTQQEQIVTLESQLKNQVGSVIATNTGIVAGKATATGILSGSVNIAHPTADTVIIVCSKETHTKQETCFDIILETEKTVYSFDFELPQGTYEVYAMTPPSETKIYYSETSTCNENGECTSNVEKKRLIKIEDEETQSDITIYL